mmetsp:Transcript_114203/g.329892  ORF Transcript_114203/g.329892 Transcript_114203/m.329892 type:complete len:253 (-) Transcript_114203:1820-2578(-)
MFFAWLSLILLISLKLLRKVSSCSSCTAFNDANCSACTSAISFNLTRASLKALASRVCLDCASCISLTSAAIFLSTPSKLLCTLCNADIARASSGGEPLNDCSNASVRLARSTICERNEELKDAVSSPTRLDIASLRDWISAFIAFNFWDRSICAPFTASASLSAEWPPADSKLSMRLPRAEHWLHNSFRRESTMCFKEVSLFLACSSMATVLVITSCMSFLCESICLRNPLTSCAKRSEAPRHSARNLSIS